MTETHPHRWKSIFKKEPWKQSPEQGLLMAYEVRVNRCDCGEERKVKTAPKGIWWKGIDIRIGSAHTYPARWKKTLAEGIRRHLEGERTISLDQMNRYGLLSGLTGAEVDELIQALVADGLAERFERYPKRTGKDVQIIISHDLLQVLRGMFGLNKRDADEEAIDVFFEEWEKSKIKEIPVGEVIDRLAGLWLKEREAILPFPEAPLRLRSLRTYHLLLKTLKAIAFLCFSEERLPFRELSIQITGRSKGLASMKPYIRRLLGDLENYGVIDHSSHLFCRIPLRGEVNGDAVDLSASVDYVVLTSATAKSFRPTAGTFKALLLVENLTSFEAMIPLLPAEVGIVWLAGFPPEYVRLFIQRLLMFNPAPGRIWCDLDPDGIEITLTVGKWFEKAEQTWAPIGMETAFFTEESGARTLDERDKGKITALKARHDAVLFREVLERMEKAGKKLEQEAINKNLFMIKFLESL